MRVSGEPQPFAWSFARPFSTTNNWTSCPSFSVQQSSHQDWMKLVLKPEAQLALRSSDIEFKSIPSPREAESSLCTDPDELVSQIFTARLILASPAAWISHVCHLLATLGPWDKILPQSPGPNLVMRIGSLGYSPTSVSSVPCFSHSPLASSTEVLSEIRNPTMGQTPWHTLMPVILYTILNLFQCLSPQVVLRSE